MDFWEELPEKCPPADATQNSLNDLYRLLEDQAAGLQAFASYRMLGKARPENVDECRWASCSLVYDPKKLVKLPRFKKTHKWVAKLSIPANSGMGQETSSNHIDFWWFKSCDIRKCVVSVIEVADV